MEGVTTAIVGFLFVCIVFPTLVKNRPQYYAALAAIIFVIVIQTIAILVEGPRDQNPATPHAFWKFALALTGFLQIAAILLLVLSCGGITARQLASDIGKTIEVVRRGGERETLIVPLRGEQPRSRDDL